VYFTEANVSSLLPCYPVRLLWLLLTCKLATAVLFEPEECTGRKRKSDFLDFYLRFVMDSGFGQRFNASRVRQIKLARSALGRTVIQFYLLTYLLTYLMQHGNSVY